MKTLVLGASGATGKLVVSKLLENKLSVKVVIRNTAAFPNELISNKNIEIITGNIDDFSIIQISELINDCDSIISCLGHNISFKGLFGKPRKLVFNAIKKVYESTQQTKKDIKLILMSTTAYTNKIIGKKNTFGESIVFALLKVLLPPHSDNVAAGRYLQYLSNKSKNIEWIAVRPDGLIDENSTSEVLIVEKKIRSPIFNPGKTSRINVAQFMADLLVNESLWSQWVYKTPVIYNREWS